MSTNVFYFGIAAKFETLPEEIIDRLGYEDTVVNVTIGQDDYVVITSPDYNMTENFSIFDISKMFDDLKEDLDYFCKKYELVVSKTKFVIDFYYNGVDNNPIYTNFDDIKELRY